MESTKFKNRFRIIGPDNEVVRINTTIDKNGHDRFVEGFETLLEAQQARNAYCLGGGLNVDDYPVKPYSETIPHIVKQRLSEAANNVVIKLKLFSGKGLKYNTTLRPRDENKYQSGKWYGREVYLAQSVERAKGFSTVAKKGDKRQRTGAGTSEIEGKEFTALKRIHNDGIFVFADVVVESLKKRVSNGQIANRKALKQYLRERNYTARQINNLIPKIYG